MMFEFARSKGFCYCCFLLGEQIKGSDEINKKIVLCNDCSSKFQRMAELIKYFDKMEILTDIVFNSVQ